MNAIAVADQLSTASVSNESANDEMQSHDLADN